MRAQEFISQLNESINITEIEDQLIQDINKRIGQHKPESLDDFSEIVKNVTVKSCKLFLDNVTGMVNTVNYSNENSSGWFKFRKHDTQVVFGFEFNEQTIQKLINTDEIDTKAVRIVVQTISHELLHAIQFDRSKLKSAGVPGKKYKKYDQSEQYYSTPEEIEAYAMNAVQEIETSGADSAKILATFNSEYPQNKLFEIIKKVSPSFRTYYLMFGEKKNDGKLQLIWNRFLKKFTYNLQTRTQEQ